MAGDARASITIVKQFAYRGNTSEEFLNTYHIDAGAPDTDTKWKALADAVIAAEKLIYTSAVKIVRAYGHVAGSVVSVWGYDYLGGTGAVAGTYAGVGTALAQGDAAAWIRYATTQKTSRGKPIFLRNYYHGVIPLASDVDKLETGQKTRFTTYGTAWVAGFSDGVSTYRRCGPNGAVGQSALASTYLTTRTLKKRGRRTA